MKPLTDRQERFVFEYSLDQNASAAAGRAGYSAKTRGTHAAQMMKNPAIRARIVVELGDLFARLKLNANEVLRAQICAAYLDPAKLFDAAQRAIPLADLDEDTRDGLSVSYALKDNGQQTLRVKQTPRHIALAVLQKRLDAFAKLQEEAFALEEEEEEAPVVVQSAEKQIPWPEATSSGAHCAQNDGGGSAGATSVKAPSRGIGQTLKDLFKFEFKLPEPAAKLEQAKTAIAQAVQAIVGKPQADMTHLWGSLAAFAAGQPVDRSDPPPPSPHEPSYNFKKDPSAMEGGRYLAWTLYWTRKRDVAREQAEQAAALGSAPPNVRVGPGRRVAMRMEPGYNPPWLRDKRPRFAIGAGETYMD